MNDGVPVSAILKVLFLVFFSFILLKLVALYQDQIASIVGAALLLYIGLFALIPEHMRDYTARIVYCIRELLNEG